MASFASVNPPFVYNPSCKPAKSILKQDSRLSRTSSSWFSSFNSRLSSVTLTYVEPSPPVEAQQQQQQQQQQQRYSGLFRKLMTTTVNDPSTPPLEPKPATEPGDELTPEELKRVHFPVGNLTTEYYPYQSAAEDEPTSDDADVLSDESASLTATTDERSAIDGRVITPRELYAFYENACINKEEPMLDVFVSTVITHQHLTCMTVLDLSHQSIDRKAAEPVADVFSLNFGLERLVLNDCGLEDDSIKVLLHSLLMNNKLHHLSLTRNKKLKMAGFKYIAIYIKGMLIGLITLKSSALQSIDLSSTLPDRKSIQHLANAIMPSTSLEAPSLNSLILDECSLRPQQLETMASAVRKSNCLRSLSLCNNRITHQGAIWVGVMLRDYDDADDGGKECRKGLERLVLDNNDIRQGVQYIAQALRRNTSLRSLSMRDCKIDEKGCGFVGEALKYNQNLEALDISLNTLNYPTTEGMMTVRQALYVNRSLKELSLAATGLGSEAAIALAECIPENKSLVRLDLSKNTNLDLAGLLALSASIKINYTLTFLDVNIPPNDRDMAKIQSDIATSCTRNAKLAALRSDDTTESAVSQSASDPNTMITTAQATARLTLQERLAAVTRVKVGSIRSSSASINSAKMEDPEPNTVSGDTSLTDEAVSQVSLFEEMLSAESKLQEDTTDPLPPGDAIMLFPRVPEKPIMESPGGSELSLGHDEPNASDLPLKPSFEIGDDDEDDFVPLQHPSALNENSHLEELRHKKEMEEGVAFKQAKDVGL
ncbi:hypothetical protein DFQ28_002070 [Apophysomyces sp. BC1034]|nr:hypothetical protein DFQ29_001537 [Apophysomyces sp. BC1021]KAG0190401.1 hypothetical protein DFQ28_002070 [Apophysomyces sp. BC1034]